MTEKENITANSCLAILLDQMLTMHYYLLFDGSEDLWQHTRKLYDERSVFRYLRHCIPYNLVASNPEFFFHL